MKVALITAAGNGTRMHLDTPKQFYEINGKPLIAYTLESFERCADIDAIAIVYLDGYLKYFQDLCHRHGYNKVRWFAKGGETNQLSIISGLKSLSGVLSDEDLVIVHDGVRPLVDSEVIRDAIDTCKKYGNAVSVTPSNEAMLYSEDSSVSSSSLDRRYIWKTQTPHVMQYREMLALVERTLAKGKTDSVAICTMLIEDGQQVHFSKGNNMNFKVTNPEDLKLFKAYLASIEKR